MHWRERRRLKAYGQAVQQGVSSALSQQSLDEQLRQRDADDARRMRESTDAFHERMSLPISQQDSLTSTGPRRYRDLVKELWS